MVENNQILYPQLNQPNQLKIWNANIWDLHSIFFFYHACSFNDVLDLYTL